MESNNAVIQGGNGHAHGDTTKCKMFYYFQGVRLCLKHGPRGMVHFIQCLPTHL